MEPLAARHEELPELEQLDRGLDPALRSRPERAQWASRGLAGHVLIQSDERHLARSTRTGRAGDRSWSASPRDAVDASGSPRSDPSIRGPRIGTRGRAARTRTRCAQPALLSQACRRHPGRAQLDTPDDGPRVAHASSSGNARAGVDAMRRQLARSADRRLCRSRGRGRVLEGQPVSGQAPAWQYPLDGQIPIVDRDDRERLDSLKSRHAPLPNVLRLQNAWSNACFPLRVRSMLSTGSDRPTCRWSAIRLPRRHAPVLANSELTRPGERSGAEARRQRLAASRSSPTGQRRPDCCSTARTARRRTASALL
jgi:hypothetical protein